MTQKVRSDVVKGESLLYVYNLLKANVLRERKTMSVILIRMDEAMKYEVLSGIQEILREKDVLFVTDQLNEIGVILTQSAFEEASGFLHRLHRAMQSPEVTFDPESHYQAAVTEVFHTDFSLDLALEKCRKSMKDNAEKRLLHVASGFDRPVLPVKVSILDADKLFREILTMSVGRIDVPGIQLDIRGFEDGLSLTQSDWAESWHPHIVILNDVLPKKNGLDVLHELRRMPSEEKFTILMMTRRNAEEDMIYSYESGADGYLVKPFNLRLFEAQVKRMLMGLWS